MATDTVRVATRRSGRRGATATVLHVNCPCKLASTLCGTYADAADAFAAHTDVELTYCARRGTYAGTWPIHWHHKARYTQAGTQWQPRDVYVIRGQADGTVLVMLPACNTVRAASPAELEFVVEYRTHGDAQAQAEATRLLAALGA